MGGLDGPHPPQPLLPPGGKASRLIPCPPRASGSRCGAEHSQRPLAACPLCLALFLLRNKWSFCIRTVSPVDPRGPGGLGPGAEPGATWATGVLEPWGYHGSQDLIRAELGRRPPGLTLMDTWPRPHGRESRRLTPPMPSDRELWGVTPSEPSSRDLGVNPPMPSDRESRRLTPPMPSDRESRRLTPPMPSDRESRRLNPPMPSDRESRRLTPPMPSDRELWGLTPPMSRSRKPQGLTLPMVSGRESWGLTPAVTSGKESHRLTPQLFQPSCARSPLSTMALGQASEMGAAGLYLSCLATVLLAVCAATESWLRLWVLGVVIHRGLWQECQLGTCTPLQGRRGRGIGLTVL
ncbi:uncharacterized protein LOC142819622 [Pelodiscus sinensis]|uniref:uncharacterized protein LOC142819622 n=1 Tax=Pelodiscus sinensis TaxID=13735 RepID=UPI003F6CEA6B